MSRQDFPRNEEDTSAPLKRRSATNSHLLLLLLLLLPVLISLPVLNSFPDAWGLGHLFQVFFCLSVAHLGRVPCILLAESLFTSLLQVQTKEPEQRQQQQEQP